MKFDSYKPGHTRKQLIELVEKKLGKKVITLVRKNLGEINAVYFITLIDGGECVVRVSPKERNYDVFEKEAWAFNACSIVGVPTPIVLALDTSQKEFPESYMISKRIKGKSGHKRFLPDPAKLDILRQFGHYLYLIHSIKIEGFGTLVKKDSEFVGKNKNLSDYLREEFESSWWAGTLIRENLVSSGEFAKIKKLFFQNEKLLDIKTASLLYGDVSLKNLIFDDNKIVGVVDMENVSAGDPVKDFSWFHFFSEGKEPYFSALKEGYDNERLFGSDFEIKMYLYELLLGLSLLNYYKSRGKKGSMEFVYRRVEEIKHQLQLSPS